MRCCFIVLSILFSHGVSAVEFYGQARDIKTAQHQYTEYHKLSQLDDGGELLVTEYKDSQGEKIAVRTAKYHNSRVVEYQLIQTTPQYSESVKRIADKILIEVTERGKTKKKQLSNASGEEVIDAGFASFAERHWEPLLTGETMEFVFVHPARKRLIDLQVKKVGMSELGGKQVVDFHMNAANSLVRLFIKPVKVGFYLNDRRLAYFKGVSNIKKTDGSMHNVNIVFAPDNYRD